MTKAKAVLIAAALLCLTGCGNHDIIGTAYNFKYAMLKMPNGQIYSGEVESWARSGESDRIRVTIDGIDYVTQYSNVCLFSEKPDWLEVEE